MGTSAETLAKADPELRQALTRTGPDEALPTMITLAPAPPPPPPPPPGPEGRQRWAQEREAEFAAETADLVKRLEPYGARGLRPLWMARSLVGELPPAAIDAAAWQPEVIRLALVVRRNVLL